MLIVGIVVVGAATGTDVSQLLSAVAGGGGGGTAESPEEDANAEFISVVLARPLVPRRLRGR